MEPLVINGQEYLPGPVTYVLKYPNPDGTLYGVENDLKNLRGAKTGTLKYDKGGLFSKKRGWVLNDSFVLDTLNITNEKPYNKDKTNIQFGDSIADTPRNQAYREQKEIYEKEQVKIEKERQDQAQKDLDNARKQALKDEQAKQAILDKQRDIDKANKLEHDKRKMEAKKEREDAEDRQLEQEIVTGILEVPRVDDKVKYNGVEATVTGEYVEITYNGKKEFVKTDTLMNISAAQRKKDAVMLKRNPPRVTLDRGDGGYGNPLKMGGTRRKRKNKKNRKTKTR